MPVDSDIKTLLKAYHSIHPKLEFPKQLGDSEILEILKKANGRKIIFVESDNEVKAFFEDAETQKAEIPNWSKLIGCGG